MGRARSVFYGDKFSSALEKDVHLGAIAIPNKEQLGALPPWFTLDWLPDLLFNTGLMVV